MSNEGGGYLDFSWDTDKCQRNITKHHIDFIDVIAIFEQNYIKLPAQEVDNEKRFMAVGILNGLCVAVVFTERSGNCRIISARLASRRERRNYDEKQK